MDFDELDAALAHAGAHAGAAECHGTLVGWLASRRAESPPPWLEPLFEDLDPDDPRVARCRDQLLALSTALAADLAAEGFRFAPLLPSDDVPLTTRVAALGEWCEGFLFGLGLAGDAATRAGVEVREVVDDFAQIARAGLDDDQGTEADEQAYAELVEYLRIGVQTVHEAMAESAPRRLH